jgi:hypothetical protein
VLESLLGRYPYVDLRAQLMGGRRSHNSGHGDVLLSWVPAVLGMTLQCLGWQHNGGDGRARSEVTEETRPTDLTSRRCPRRVQSRWPYPF